MLCRVVKNHRIERRQQGSRARSLYKGANEPRRAEETLETSYEVEQRSRSSAAGKAFNAGGAVAAGTDELAQLVRKDQDITAEAERLNKSIVSAVLQAPSRTKCRSRSPDAQAR
jgi:hypothetical protein